MKSSSAPTAIATPAGCLATNAAVCFVFSAALAAAWARKIKQGYRSHKLKPYREAAKAEKAAFKANVDFQYHKTLHDNPQLTSNPISRFWQKQQIKKQYAKEARNTAKGIKGAAERTRKAAAKAAEKTKQTAAFVARHPAYARCRPRLSMCRCVLPPGSVFPLPRSASACIAD